MNPDGIQGTNLNMLAQRFRFRRGLLFGVIIITALLAFEVFNYSTTDFALADLLGDLNFLGIRWATILAIAFCGIDFAGIARLFTPEDGAEEPGEVWYLFGAWLLAATMNAMLTWWGVSLAVLNHETLGNAVVERTTLLRVVPVFVAILVWLIRVLIIGTFSVAGDRIFSQGEQRIRSTQRPYTAAGAMMTGAPPIRSLGNRAPAQHSAASANTFRPAPKIPANNPPETGYNNRAEPTYHPLSMSSPTSGKTSGNPQQLPSGSARPPKSGGGYHTRR